MDFTYGILTVSDSTSRGERDDTSAQEADLLLKGIGGKCLARSVVPDEISQIKEALLNMCDHLRIDLIVTTGGTGLHPRDVTPEATRALLHKEIPGMAEAMRAAGIKSTPHAMLSRGIVGIRGSTIIINLPGSPRAVKESLSTLLPALPHALEKVKGDPTPCGRA